MAISKASLKQKIETELKAQGFVLDGEFAMAGMMAEAIANAVVDEINQNAKVIVESGSSAGSYSVN
ncbi:hypothetical protein [Vibrio cyclitrophicus]|uniref:hypothetical protein n=1 Tax=Vibrio cyclitrophicus TaxID=47951 RepID=UPI0002EC9EDA|nr:hypothetical protein [Vibrio cyclitrophicus]ERM57949.1 hypothetical protein M565_ctg5P0920 [Vibrio cyclitrophicus FF75]OEE49875.1 hypothetical protein OAG_00210 [Vibrio cyclitrophicus FF75]